MARRRSKLTLTFLSAAMAVALMTTSSVYAAPKNHGKRARQQISGSKLDRIAKRLNMTADQLEEELQEKTLPEVAEEHGVTLDKRHRLRL